MAVQRESIVTTYLMEEEQLVELRHDRDLKLLNMQLPLGEFWVQIKTKYPHVAKKALVMLIQFSTSYQFELGFSALANTKTNKRESLKTPEEEMRRADSPGTPPLSGEFVLSEKRCVREEGKFPCLGELYLALFSR
ncbi:protein FAM200A-like [Palaemon carinicauda]|uniref:protein FAM200A-like n=1 Tax=Palaemon carinicauda TaxID=392227 RepID=UPI0035B5984C